MTNYPICEIIKDYEPLFDDVNNCYKDMNSGELKINYGNISFKCCGMEYNKNKRYKFVHSHCKSNKHKIFMRRYNEEFRQNYGTYRSPAEIIKAMEKEIRELKKQLYNKNQECQYKDTDLDKINKLYENLQLENIRLDAKKKKKFEELFQKE